MKNWYVNPGSILSLVLCAILGLLSGLSLIAPAMTQPAVAGLLLPDPDLDLKIHTNGQHADTPPGPEVLIGQDMTWEYIITNSGDRTLTDIVVTDDILDTVGTIDSLAPGDTAILAATGTADSGQYANIGTATGQYGDKNFSDTDTSHYFGVSLCLNIEKHTNGEDADSPSGPEVLVGDTVTWEYTVTNCSNVTLSDILVTDNILGDIGTIESLAPDEYVTLTATGIAQGGQHENIGTAQAEYLDQTVTDSDLSHYFGVDNSDLPLDTEKYTNADGEQDSGPSEGTTANPPCDSSDGGGETESTDDESAAPGEPEDESSDSSSLMSWDQAGTFAGPVFVGFVAFALTIAIGLFLTRQVD